MYQMELIHCCRQETFVISGEGEGFNTYNISQRTKFCYITQRLNIVIWKTYETVLYKASHLHDILQVK